ncbi:MAG: hypothetical protein ACXVBW_11750, partial [Bdellovibrionota bacterium]
SLPAISKMVDGLVEKGWIIRTFREGNRKQIFLKLTPQGRARYLKFRAAAQKAIAARLGKIEKKGRGTIHDGLAELESWLHRK